MEGTMRIAIALLLSILLAPGNLFAYRTMSMPGPPAKKETYYVCVHYSKKSTYNEKNKNNLPMTVDFSGCKPNIQRLRKGETKWFSCKQKSSDKVRLGFQWKGYDKDYWDFKKASTSNKCGSKNTLTINVGQRGYKPQVWDGEGDW